MQYIRTTGSLLHGIALRIYGSNIAIPKVYMCIAKNVSNKAKIMILSKISHLSLYYRSSLHSNIWL